MITTERIAELRTILNADLLDQGTAFYMACDDLPSALDTIEAQQRRIEELEAALKPFADVAESDIGNDETDEDTFRPMSSQKVAISPLLTVGNLRTARTALQPKEPS